MERGGKEGEWGSGEIVLLRMVVIPNYYLSTGVGIPGHTITTTEHRWVHFAHLFNDRSFDQTEIWWSGGRG